jgi:hypothetical protein
MNNKEKLHTTNYTNTFIEIAEDCPALQSEIPPAKGENKTVANIHFEMISKHPYQYTSDDVVFQAYAEKNGLTKADMPLARKEFFSKGQPCLRCSPLTKRYGFGVHSNEEGKVALYGMETKEYKKFLADAKLQKVKAMRSKRA